MAISHAQRVQMYNGLCEELTVDVANTLMEHLPPDGWSEVAMKSDIAELRAETKTEFAEVRADISVLRSELKVLGASFNETLATAIAKQNKWMVGVMTSLTVAMIVALVR